MPTISIQLSDEQFAQVEQLSRDTGASIDEIVRRCAVLHLCPPEEGFRIAMNYVLAKNAELYQGLGK